MKFFSVFFLVLTQIVFLRSAFASGPCIDSDGDGWGWDGSASCIVDANSQTSTSNPTISGSNTACLDTDGDGWGWNGSATCIVGANSQTSTPTPKISGSNTACLDTDGDGWGWDGSATCIVGANSQTSASTPKISGSSTATKNNLATRPIYKANDVGQCSRTENLINNNEDMTRYVTDVILTAGQSNAAGNKTEYDPDTYIQDQKDSRLLVWTTDNRWEVADPASQTWDIENRQPFWKNRPKQYHNHPAFQIGKGILKEDPCRVVAIIASAAPGQVIDYWLNNSNNHYGGIRSKVSSAIQALPNKSTVDMIWWMQGESDEGLATGSPDTYLNKLNQLIQRFKSNNWFSNTGYFLANETRIRYKVNEVIRRLRIDGNSYTDYSDGEVLPGQQNLYPSLASEIRQNVFVHFNDDALRRIGNNVARKYSAYKGF